jgi:hypothetical protein
MKEERSSLNCLESPTERWYTARWTERERNPCRIPQLVILKQKGMIVMYLLKIDSNN